MIGGDIIIGIDDQEINSADNLKQSLAKTTPGQEITFSILRNGDEQSIIVTLAEKPVQ